MAWKVASDGEVQAVLDVHVQACLDEDVVMAVGSWTAWLTAGMQDQTRRDQKRQDQTVAWCLQVVARKPCMVALTVVLMAGWARLSSKQEQKTTGWTLQSPQSTLMVA